MTNCSQSEEARIKALCDGWVSKLEAAPESKVQSPAKKSRYSTDPEFREYRKEISRQNYNKRKKRKEQARGEDQSN